MTDQGKPSVCPKCGSDDPILLRRECRVSIHPYHSSPVPAATTKRDTALHGLIAVLRFALDRPNDQTWRPNAERAIKLASAPQAESVPAHLDVCPFCGGGGIYDQEGEQHFVRCRSCAAEGGWAKSINGAARCWNMRQRIEPDLSGCPENEA